MNTNPQRILIVEDQLSLAEVLAEYLQQSGFEAHFVTDGLDAVPAIKAHNPALVILDLMLPGRDGLEIYRELRTFSDVPVIMATARVDEIDRLLGLELGADDYVCKPYSPRELVARVKNVLRRVSMPLAQRANESGLKLDKERMRVTVNGKSPELTPVEFRLLCHLFENEDRVFSRSQLLDCIYNDYRAVSDRTVDSHIKNLRRKLAEVMPGQEVIKSVYGVGYKLEL